MQNHMNKIQTLIVKQALRDLASVKLRLREDALAFFFSTDFRTMSEQMKMDHVLFEMAIKELIQYPLVSRKRLVETMIKNLEEGVETT